LVNVTCAWAAGAPAKAASMVTTATDTGTKKPALLTRGKPLMVLMHYLPRQAFSVLWT